MEHIIKNLGGKPSLRKKKSTFLNAYDKSLCNISASCSIAKISRTTFYRWKAEDTYFAECIDDLIEENIDYVEQQLMKNIREQKEASIFFFLKTKGKHRGYIETIDNQITLNPFEELLKVATSIDED